MVSSTGSRRVVPECGEQVCVYFKTHSPAVGIRPGSGAGRRFRAAGSRAMGSGGTPMTSSTAVDGIARGLPPPASTLASGVA